MPDQRAVEAFDPKIADRFIASQDKQGGLPAYLGTRFTAYEPGILRAEMPVRDELLTMIGNMHGGVLSALCDHMLQIRISNEGRGVCLAQGTVLIRDPKK